MVGVSRWAALVWGTLHRNSLPKSSSGALIHNNLEVKSGKMSLMLKEKAFLVLSAYYSMDVIREKLMDIQYDLPFECERRRVTKNHGGFNIQDANFLRQLIVKTGEFIVYFERKEAEKRKLVTLMLTAYLHIYNSTYYLFI